jgi:hypothetical protein
MANTAANSPEPTWQRASVVHRAHGSGGQPADSIDLAVIQWSTRDQNDMVLDTRIRAGLSRTYRLATR